MDRLILLLATGFYTGKIGWAPGSWGSLCGLLIWLTLRGLSPSSYLLVMLTILVAGFFIAGSAEKLLDRPDPGCIVIDEILGILITMTARTIPPPGCWASCYSGFSI